MKDRDVLMVGIEEAMNRKLEIIEAFLRIAANQHVILSQKDMDLEVFDRTLDEKEALMETLGQIDTIMDELTARGQKLLGTDLEAYMERIEALKKQSDRMDWIGSQLKELEEKNKRFLDNFISSKRQDVKNFRRTKYATNHYNQNMRNAHQNDRSYFMDRKK